VNVGAGGGITGGAMSSQLGGGPPPPPPPGKGASVFTDDENRRHPRSEIDEAIVVYSFPHSPQPSNLLLNREFTPGILSANDSFRLEMERRLR
jgi:hypothetical protein